MTDILSIINCPSCGGRLKRISKSLICENRHTFDVSKQGYVNLLPPGKEKNARTGDEQNMVKARVDFLSNGYYKNISDKLASLLAKYIYTDDGSVVLCDMGCGEGYHTCNFSKGFHEQTGIPALTLGFDASKHAAAYSSRLSRNLGMMPKEGIGAACDSFAQTYFMPANIFRLPIEDSSANAAVSMFAPIAWDEVRRILKPGGLLAVVSSGMNHLMEMRQLIYDEVHISDFVPETAVGFAEICRDSLTYTVELQCGDDIKNLFMMTPFYYKTTEEGRERLYEKEKLTVTVDVNYTVFKVE